MKTMENKDELEEKHDPFSAEYDEDAMTEKEVRILKHCSDKKQKKLKTY